MQISVFLKILYCGLWTINYLKVGGQHIDNLLVALKQMAVFIEPFIEHWDG